VLAAAERAAGPDELTRREREVVAELTSGKTNRQIAEALSIAEKTVEMHVSNSLAKLGFQSRAQLAGWAVGRDLAPAPEPKDG
jgi:DNA-binding NarL/FixJ family response regulator